LLVLGLAIVAIIFILPTLLGGAPAGLGFLPDKQVKLGLDLQGGTHLILTVEVDKAVANSVQVNGEALGRELRKGGFATKEIKRISDTEIEATVGSGEKDKFETLLGDQFPNFGVKEARAEGDKVVTRVALLPAEIARIRQSAVDQSLETIRNRIDQFGVSEPVIQRQGQNDILVQLPGVQDPKRAKELIGKTAVLEFKLVREDANLQAYVEGNRPIPAGTQILYEAKKDELGHRRKGDALLVESRTLMTGDVVVDAKVRPGELPNSRVVLLSLNPRGARIFEEITGENVNKRLAIVLDDTIYSAPVIRERIGGGSAQIEGDFSSDEARDLTIVLNTGALPAPVTVAEERTVGPSLGRDSIRKGLLSFIVGGSMVVIFMIVYYKFAGLLANVALVFNILFLIASLAMLGATLTLPGIAGIVLTIGMAVDANVLINERIREELRLGKSARAAIDAGYERALPSILDSNITTFLAGLIMFQFGSGPVKGFAVTLCIGLISSVFTAVIGTRVVYDHLLARRALKTVSV
jgi:preprotein translocase subunit SecD